MPCVIIFAKPVRIGKHILECVGPFANLDDAKFWYLVETNNSIMGMPDCTVMDLTNPEDIDCGYSNEEIIRYKITTKPDTQDRGPTDE